jgi:pilus assembly protein Flp/PilA
VVVNLLYRRQGETSLRHPILESDERKKTQMKNVLMRLWKEEEGQDLVEYVLLVVIVALGAIAGMGTLATAINSAFGSAAGNLAT